MRIRMTLVVVGVLAVLAGSATRAQISGNRVVAPIVKKGLVVLIKDVVRLSESRGLRPADARRGGLGGAAARLVRVDVSKARSEPPAAGAIDGRAGRLIANADYKQPDNLAALPLKGGKNRRRCVEIPQANSTFETWSTTDRAGSRCSRPRGTRPA